MKQHKFFQAVSLVALTAFVYTPLQAGAQSEKELAAQQGDELLRRHEDNQGIFTATLENDIFSGEDDNYTNGVRFAFLSSEDTTPRWMEKGADALPFFNTEGRKRWGFSFGQSMFTPSDITKRELQRNERPYAGWTYGTAGIISDTGYTMDTLQLTLGVVGPASGAEQTQKFVHSIIDSENPEGWHNQLENEPGAILTYERKWRGLYEFSPFGFGADITPNVGASLGNVYTHASTGAVVRFGYDLPSDYGPPLIRPSMTGSDFFVPTQDFGWYFFAGVEGRAVARNIFLDGNTFDDSHSVDKEPFVGNTQVGFAVTFNNTRVAYTHIFNSKEYKGQPEKDEFGALSVSWRF